MSTLKQVAANRRNGGKSHGPSSAAGKAVSRMNALKFGIDAKTTVIPGEHSAEFEVLLDALFEEHKPVTPTEQGFVSILGHSLWRPHRLMKGRRTTVDRLHSPDRTRAAPLPRRPLGWTYGTTTCFPRIERHLTSIYRTTERCLDQLRRLPAEPPSSRNPNPSRSPSRSRNPSRNL